MSPGQTWQKKGKDRMWLDPPLWLPAGDGIFRKFMLIFISLLEKSIQLPGMIVIQKGGIQGPLDNLLTSLSTGSIGDPKPEAYTRFLLP